MTTTVRADIQNEAPRSAVWRTLADLETRQDYDTEVVRSFYVSEAREGVGAATLGTVRAHRTAANLEFGRVGRWTGAV